MKTLKAGCVLVDLQENKIGLVYRKSKKDYSFPKGHLESGESLEECAIRETEEETGRRCYIICKKELGILRYVTPAGEDVENYMYLAIDAGESRKVILESLKEELVWADIENTSELLSYDDLKEFWNDNKEIIKHEIEKQNKTIFEEIKIEELEKALKLVKEVFDEFEAVDYSNEGVTSFYKFANYETIREMLKKNLKMIVAKQNEKIVGVIAYRDYSHISMLFVDKEYHRQGIARRLVIEMEKDCLKNNKQLTEITLNSSPYAIDFYHKIGFKDISEEKIVDGIRFTPMKKEI